MEEDTWDSNPERSGLKDSAALISQGAHNPPSSHSSVQVNPEGMIQNGCNSGCETCPFQVDVESNKFKIGAFLAPTVQVTRGYIYTFNVTSATNPFHLSRKRDGVHAGGGRVHKKDPRYTDDIDDLLDTGLVTFRPGDNTPDTLFYYSKNHVWYGRQN